MSSAPSSAATNAPGRKTPCCTAIEVPTSTGATAAGSVRTRAAMSQIRIASLRTAVAMPRLRPLREAREVRRALLPVGVAALLRLGVLVEEQVGVVGELLDAAEAVL